MAKIINISDIGSVATYRLSATSLEMIGGDCGDALSKAGCLLDEAMPDETIIAKVYEAWEKDYDGDPDESELEVAVMSEEEKLHWMRSNGLISYDLKVEDWTEEEKLDWWLSDAICE